jgi:hypothetical protein
MKLEWLSVGPPFGDGEAWDLVMHGRGYVTRFGRMYVVDGGYMVQQWDTASVLKRKLPLDPDSITRTACRILDDHLTLDEAQRAAKLLLMVGHEHA